MTYLDAVKQVLMRLREPTVADVNQTPYSSLIGVLLNDAKAEVEAAWAWSGLRSTTTVSTTPSVFGYELQDTNNSSTFLSVTNDTTNCELTYATAKQFNDWYIKNTPASGSPKYYTFNGVSADGDTYMEFYPQPNAQEVIRINFIQRGMELILNTHTLQVPSRPVLLLAYAKAVEERGEDGGVGSGPAYSMATRSLSDHIALDAQKHPEETFWEAV